MNNFKTKKQLKEFEDELKLMLSDKPSDKPQATSDKPQAIRKFESEIKSVHDQWCVDNGYSIDKPTSGKPGRPKRQAER